LAGRGADLVSRDRDQRPRGGSKRGRRAKGAGAKSEKRASAEERRARIDFFEQARAYTPTLEVRIDGAAFLVPTDDAMGRTLFLKRRRREFEVLSRAVASVQAIAGDDAIHGRAFVDIGANIGTATISALVSHGFGSAVACEPESENYRLLRANLALNEVEDRARALRVAASDRVGRSQLVVTEGSRGSSWVAIDSSDGPPAEPPSTEVVEVAAVSLDRLVEDDVIDPGRVGMLWIDAQGHEGQVLKGAETLADRATPVVFELHPAGLDEHGDRDLLNEVVASHYTHFIDMRRADNTGRAPDFRPHPASDLPGHSAHLLDPSTPWEVTDLLAVRIGSGHRDLAAKLPELVDQRLARAAAPR
jgi:FkbM family methyltransferase